MQITKRFTVVMILIAICLYIPLLDSLFPGTLFGLNWHSPAVMAELGENLRIIKLILIVFSIFLIGCENETIRACITKKFLASTFINLSFIFAILQLPFLGLGIMLDKTSLSNTDYIHKEKAFEQGTIYVYTADPGAMGKAYHYFFLKCDQPLNRYKLKQLIKTDWMKTFDYELNNNQLIIKEINDENRVFKIDIKSLNCD